MIRKEETDIGLKIFTVRKEQIPVVFFRFVLMSGSADDPQGKEGLASFMANLMRRGTATYSRSEIEEMLDFIASDLWIHCQKDITVFGGRVLVDNLAKFYSVFSEMLLKPSFPEEEIEKLKVDQIDDIEFIRQNDEALVREAFSNFLYQCHPYGHLDAGRIATVKSFTRDHVLNFYEKHFRRGNLLIGLGGDIPDSLIARIREDFAGLPAVDMARKRTQVEKPERKKVLVIEKEGRAQTQLRIGHPITVTRKDPDYHGLLIANNYLGKHRVSIGRLYNKIREKRGLSYGAYSYIEHFLGSSGPIKLPRPTLARREQYFAMWTYPKNENAKFVIKLVLKEMEDLVREGIDDQRLQEAKNYTINNFPFEVETPDRKLGMLLDDEIYGSKDFVENFEENVRKVTSEDIREVVRKHLYPDRVAIAVLVSDGQKFIDEMLSPETNVEYPSGVDPAALENEDRVIERFDLGLEREDFQIVRSSDLFQ
ncbi:MAG: pitrilysin family protein [Acidobacteriota bacterium]